MSTIHKFTNTLTDKISDKLSIGMDIGSTTAKIAITRGGELLYARYERHFSKVRSKILEMLQAAKDVLGDLPFTAALSGSAGNGTLEILFPEAGLKKLSCQWVAEHCAY